MTVRVRRAKPADIDAIFDLIRGLADYEGDLLELRATKDDLSIALFSEIPHVFGDVAEDAGEVLGLAVWFYTFSTYPGRHGIYLEDLFVKEEHRGHGIGKALLSRLARRCCEEDLCRLEWMVLSWNEPAIDFYRSQGAKPLEGRMKYRLDGQELEKLGRYRAT